MQKDFCNKIGTKRTLVRWPIVSVTGGLCCKTRPVSIAEFSCEFSRPLWGVIRGLFNEGSTCARRALQFSTVRKVPTSMTFVTKLFRSVLSNIDHSARVASAYVGDITAPHVASFGD